MKFAAAFVANGNEGFFFDGKPRTVGDCIFRQEPKGKFKGFRFHAAHLSDDNADFRYARRVVFLRRIKRDMQNSFGKRRFMHRSKTSLEIFRVL